MSVTRVFLTTCLCLASGMAGVQALDVGSAGVSIVRSIEEVREKEQEPTLRDVYMEAKYPDGLDAVPPPDPNAYGTGSEDVASFEGEQERQRDEAAKFLFGE